MFTYQEIESLNELELEVYKYIVKNYDSVKVATIREIARHTHVSTTTILRFCRKMGCEGFNEFKYKLRDHMNSTKKDYNFSTDDFAIQDFLIRTKEPLFLQKIYDASQLIVNSKQIIFLGIGTSGILAKYASHCFMNAGRFSQYIDYPYFEVPDGFFDGTVIIVFSVSGETVDVINQLHQFRKFNCAVITITNAEYSTIAKISDMVINYNLPMNIKGKSKINFTSQIPVIYIIEELVYNISQFLNKQEL
ncbi:MurR/RpiR family transcriptional regulator [Clostridium botulinum]|nr:MurR/RpiR family transcriptional regulator [Clostridium botulinum]